jgi:hypothetical protein
MIASCTDLSRNFSMLTQSRLPVSLSLISTDLPLLSTIETSGILSQKDQQQFHLLLNQLDTPQSVIDPESIAAPRSRLLWLEISPSRAVMTIQGTGKFACRHFWEKGIYGKSRYWLNDEASSTFCLQNFTRNLQLSSNYLPRSLRIDYELWAGRLQLGHYVLHLEIYH